MKLFQTNKLNLVKYHRILTVINGEEVSYSNCWSFAHLWKFFMLLLKNFPTIIAINLTRFVNLTDIF